MEAFLIYLLKASGIIILFYLCYQALLKKETFFNVNRHFLIIGIFLAIVLPLISIPNYVEITTLPFNTVAIDSETIAISPAVSQIDWVSVLFVLYLVGVAILAARFMIQLGSLLRLILGNKVSKQGQFYLVDVQSDISPFSFFNYIFYNSSLYTQNELTAIIEHEKAHSSQWHSLDVVLSHLITICAWPNPFSWLYQTNIKQNLEFLADESATKDAVSIKTYQYTLLKVSGNSLCTPIVNNFYNSLIKKRIVMLNKSKSNKKNSLKVALVLPALALFLISFNTRDIYIPIAPENDSYAEEYMPAKSIEIRIDKDTTDEELAELKKDLAVKGIDFSYTVVHNAKKEIIEISVDFASTKEDGNKMRRSSNFNNGDQPIDPIHITYDDTSNSFSMGSIKGVQVKVDEDKDVHVDVRKEIHKETEHTVWVHSDSDDDTLKTIEIIDENGKETIKINGKKATRKELKKLKKKDAVHEKHIKIKKHKADDKHVYIMKDTDHDSDIDIEVISKEGKGFFFKDAENGEKPLIVIDGEISKEQAMSKLDPNEFYSMSIIKDEKAQEPYGKKGKGGVIKIITKKSKD